MSEQKSRCPGCEPTAQDHVHPAMGARFAQLDLGPDHCLVCHHLEAAPAPPAAPGTAPRPQPAPRPEIDAAGFGPCPSDEEIRAHERGGVRWLAREATIEAQPGQLRGLLLGRFLGGTWRSNGRDFGPAMMTGWSFCPVDENGDKLDAAPVLRGEDARRLVEQLGEVAPPEEIARRRAEARRHLLAQLGPAMSEFQKTTQAISDGLSKIRWLSGSDFGRVELPREPAKPLTEADRCPQCDEYLMPCPRCPPSRPAGLAPQGEIPHRGEERRHLAELDRLVSRMRADARTFNKGVLVSKLGDEIQVDGFKDEHIRLALGRKTAQRILATLPERSPDRRVLVVLRGLPGSGKSTIAQAIVDSDPARWVRVSKDDLRQMMVGPSGDLFRFVEDRAREMVVSKVAEEMATSALRLGLDVVVDATNLTERALGSWRTAAMVVNRDGRGPVLVCERAVPTPVEECVARDARRGKRSVGEAVIRRLAATIDLPLADKDQEVS